MGFLSSGSFSTFFYFLLLSFTFFYFLLLSFTFVITMPTEADIPAVPGHESASTGMPMINPGSTDPYSPRGCRHGCIESRHPAGAGG